jgi:ATP-dependent protease ClpP protease subunit
MTFTAGCSKTVLSSWAATSTKPAPISSSPSYLFLQAEDGKKDIFFYINSPGGSVYDALGDL